MGDGLKRASDYANRRLALLLHDAKSGECKVTDRYLLSALEWKIERRPNLPEWVTRFAARHALAVKRYEQQECYTFTALRKPST